MRNKVGIAFFTILYLFLFCLKKSEIYYPFVSDYLADLICIPLVLAWTAIILKWIGSDFVINNIAILIAVIYFSVVFEWMIPHFSSNYTADWLDVFCYFLGGLIFALRKRIISEKFLAI